MFKNRPAYFIGLIGLVVSGSVVAARAPAQTGNMAQADSVDSKKELEVGKRVPLCPELRLPASHGSMKVMSRDGSVLGSGLTGQRPSVAKCAGRRIAWQRQLDTLPTSLVPYWSLTYYAGMTPGKNVALGVGELDQNGQSKWFQRVDSSGDELGAIAAVGAHKYSPSLYVLTGSTGKLPGQAASATGYRFLARFDASREAKGQLAWLKQSRDFGRRPSQNGGGRDGTSAALAADERGGVYVLSSLAPEGAVADESGQARLAKLTKLNHLGKTVWQRVVTINVKPLGSPRFRGTLRVVTVDGDGSSVYVAGDAVVGTDSQLIAMRLDRNGQPRWTKLISLSYGAEWSSDDGSTMEVSGRVEEVRGIAVSAESLLVVTSYQNDFFETWEGEEEEEEMLGMGGSRDSNHVAAVANLDSVSGTLRWARQYEGLGPDYHGASELQPSGIRTFDSGAIAITGSEDIWVTQTSQRYEDVPALFLLSDAQVQERYEGSELPYAADIEFYDELSSAVKRKDKRWLAEHTAFPLCCLAPGERQIENKAAFLAQFDSIFNERVIESVDNTKRHMIYRAELGLSTSDNTLQFAFVEPSDKGTPDYRIIVVDNQMFGEGPGPEAASSAAVPPDPNADSLQPKEAIQAEPDVEADASSASKREKMKAWFKEQNRQAQQKNKQKQQQQQK